MRFAIAVVAAALLLTGCASSTDPSPPPSPAPTTFGTATPIPNARTFTSAGTGFSVTWDAGKLAATTHPPAAAITRQTDLITLTLLDRDAGDQPYPWKGLGGMSVLAQRISESPPPLAEMRRILTDPDTADALAPTLLRMRLKQLRISNVGPTTVNGVSGYRATYVWPTGRSEYYVLFSGRGVYRLTLGASNDSLEAIWPTLNAALQSFTVKQ